MMPRTTLLPRFPAVNAGRTIGIRVMIARDIVKSAEPSSPSCLRAAAKPSARTISRNDCEPGLLPLPTLCVTIPTLRRSALKCPPDTHNICGRLNQLHEHSAYKEQRDWLGWGVFKKRFSSTVPYISLYRSYLQFGSRWIGGLGHEHRLYSQERREVVRTPQ